MCKNEYNRILTHKLHLISSKPLLTANDVQSMTDDICSALHSAARESHCECVVRAPSAIGRLVKPYCAPDLRALAKRKRFWFRLWKSCGRPRSGEVFKCYKQIKKTFRRGYRKSLQQSVENHYSNMSSLFRSNPTRFWKQFNKKKKNVVPITAESFSKYYADLLYDKREYTTRKHARIHSTVTEWFTNWSSRPLIFPFDVTRVSELILKLPLNSAAGADGVTSEHLRFGHSNALLTCFKRLFEAIVQLCSIPEQFLVGTIVPILKKNTSDPINPNNYRPLTMTSVIAKLFELSTLTPATLSSSQFGFREGIGVDMAGAAINDIIRLFNGKRSPVLLTALDAHKCFDSIWTQGLFYKLSSYLPRPLWCCYYKWYTNMVAEVRVGDVTSNQFPVSRGTRQGSCSSPTFFTVFIDELLCRLNSSDCGVSLNDSLHVGCIAYADDVTLLSTNTVNMQALLSICEQYSKEWRFTFNPQKTQSLVVGKWPFCTPPDLTLYGTTLPRASSAEILGFHFDSVGKYTSHIRSRESKCGSAYYSAVPKGLSFPGLHPYVKAKIFQSICQSTLTYGIGALDISPSSLNHLNTYQNNFIKKFMGLPRRSGSTPLLDALHLKNIDLLVSNRTVNILHRTFCKPNLLRDICFVCMDNAPVRGTLLSRTLSLCDGNFNNLIHIIYQVPHKNVHPHSGISDSIKTLFNTFHLLPNTEGQLLLELLTKSF